MRGLYEPVGEGMARAAGQCEMEAGFGRRCSRAAEHGDHLYPWSKGGSTSLQNFVAASCVKAYDFRHVCLLLKHGQVSVR